MSGNLCDPSANKMAELGFGQGLAAEPRLLSAVLAAVSS